MDKVRIKKSHRSCFYLESDSIGLAETIGVRKEPAELRAIAGSLQTAINVTSSNHLQAAVRSVRIIKSHVDIGQQVHMPAVMDPVGRILMPAKTRAALRALQIQLVGPDRDRFLAQDIPNRIHNSEITHQGINPRVKVLHRLDHTDGV